MDRSKGVMGRMEWFSHLKQIFSRLQNPESSSVPINRYLEYLYSHPPGLEDPATYARTNVMALSMEEVQSALQAFSGQEITWNEVIDMVLQVSIQKKVGQSSIEDHSHREIREVPSFNSNLQHLSLAGNLLEHTRWQFPDSLVLLNLAGNQISQVSFLVPLENLRLLNLSNNNIIQVENPVYFKRIRELYIAYNLLKSISFAKALVHLRIVDCSYNELRVPEELTNLDGLLALKVRGNPVSRTADLKGLFSNSCKVDPISITELSEFRFHRHAFEPSRNTNQIFTDRSSLPYTSRMTSSEIDRKSQMSHYCDSLPPRDVKSSFCNIRIPDKEKLEGFKFNDIGSIDLKNSNSESKFALHYNKTAKSQLRVSKNVLGINNSPSKEIKFIDSGANHHKIYGSNDPAMIRSYSPNAKDYETEEKGWKKKDVDYQQIDIYGKEKGMDMDDYHGTQRSSHKSDEGSYSKMHGNQYERITEREKIMKSFDRYERYQGLKDKNYDMPVQITEDKNLEKTPNTYEIFNITDKKNSSKATSKEKFNLKNSQFLPYNQKTPKDLFKSYKSANALHLTKGKKTSKIIRGKSQKNGHRSTPKMSKGGSKLLTHEKKTFENNTIDKPSPFLSNPLGNLTYQGASKNKETKNPTLDGPNFYSFQKDPLIGNVLDKANNRISINKTVNSKQEHKSSNKVIVTSEYIEKSKTNTYDNPIKVMMIRPAKK